jgi:tetratricopeptide (TPR) repeat protein
LAQAFQNKQQYEKAIKYLNEALSVESDSAEKEKLLVRIGVVQLALKNYSKAREAALAAQAINAEDGMTYFVLAQCYASQASSSTIQTQAMYWVAYDTMDKASSLLTDADIKAQANRMKGAYRSAWPSKEECFFNEISVGQRFVVNGIATTVRCDK